MKKNSVLLFKDLPFEERLRILRNMSNVFPPMTIVKDKLTNQAKILRQMDRILVKMEKLCP